MILNLQLGQKKNYNLSGVNSIGYTCIHHPDGDAKKINIDNDEAYTIGTSDFDLYFDAGLSEPGTSGAPIFNDSKQVVGWATGGSKSADCQYIGQVTSQNITLCGNFNDAYSDFYPLLDPGLTGEATSSNPEPPTPPAHCSNCIQDYDETGIDWGGTDCSPCGMADVLTLKSMADITKSKVQSRYELFAEPDPNSLLALESGSYTFEAGMNVHLNGGFEVGKGTYFYAGINSDLMSQPDRQCQDYCFAYEQSFTPDGDGNNDYLSISQSFLTKYSIEIYDGRWTLSNLIYSKSDVPIYSNGIINIWDGAEAIHNENSVILTYYDCWGNPHRQEYMIGAYSLKSASLIEDDQTDEAGIDNENIKIKVYPNPFSEKVIIDFSGDTSSFKYKVTDINGKIIVKNSVLSNRETIDLKDLTSGVYLINVKAGKYNLVKKIIKE